MLSDLMLNYLIFKRLSLQPFTWLVYKTKYILFNNVNVFLSQECIVLLKDSKDLLDIVMLAITAPRGL